jgi:glucose/arabinose dehydrogenase
MNTNTIVFTLSICIIFAGSFSIAFGEPTLYDDNLVLEKFTSEFGWMYTTMTFIENDLLILEKDGFVTLIRDGVIQDEPILEILVDPVRESGLLGITSVNSTVYLYFTEADKDGNQLGNRIYKYDWNGESLINPILLKELPSNDYHNSGVLEVGLDGQVYAIVGDTGIYGPLQNKLLEDLFPSNTIEYMDTSVILRVEPEGPYYAMGIRNSFGLTVDPVTGRLWETENGDDDFDEINLISDKHNGGWERIMGLATQTELDRLPGYEDYIYHDPEFSWEKVVAPAGLGFAEFKETDSYYNSLFVGDCNNGHLYKFELNQNRDGLEFTSPDLQDKVANKNDSMEEIIIGTGFKCITDMETGPDGFLYLMSHGERTIYRILPIEALALEDQPSVSESESSEGGGCLVATATYGSELAPQVQQLRELRDNKLLQTESGSAFMKSFNNFYYSFSPIIADFERENPVLKEVIKLAITPMIFSLSVLNHVDLDTEAKVLGYGISLILLNIGMYIGIPGIVITRISKKI